MIEVGTKVKLTEKAYNGELFGKSWKGLHEIQKVDWFDIGKTMCKYYVNGLWFFEKELEVYTQEEFPEYYI
jgi:hypothetical protein